MVMLLSEKFISPISTGTPRLLESLLAIISGNRDLAKKNMMTPAKTQRTMIPARLLNNVLMETSYL
jgi:hypothetical protein